MVKEIKIYMEHSRRPWFSLSRTLSDIYHDMNPPKLIKEAAAVIARL